MTPLSLLYRARLALGLALLSLALTSSFAAEAVKAFDVAAGDAATTLKQAAKQGGVEIVFPATTVAGVKTAPVKGDFTAREALNRMLAGTDLVLVQDEKTGALTVNRLPAESKNAPSRPAEAMAAGTNTRVSAEGSKVENGVVKLGTFEVLSSKLINADIPRTRDDVQPYVVFSRDQIEGANATNLDDFFRTRLPMNNVPGGIPASQGGPVNTSGIALRGLNVAQTLILIDGRRAPSRGTVGTSVTFSQADVNGIPLSMIERIEILPSTASGIYGGGATGGVINIITRKDFSGVELTLNYGNTFETDSAQRRIDLNGSLALEDGKTQLTFSSSYSDTNMMQVQDRDFTTRARALQFANNPAAFTASSFPPSGYTPNIRSQTGTNLVLKPQFAVGGVTALNSPFTSIPVGYAGVATTGVAPLLARAGTYNLDLPDSYMGGRRNALGNEATMRSLSLGARRKFGANFEAFVDLSAQDSLAETLSGGSVSNFSTLSAAAPNNPFTTPIIVTWPVTRLAEIYPFESRMRTATGGVVVRLPQDWTGGVDYLWSRSNSGQLPPLNLVGDPDGTGPLPSFTSSIANGTLDVMRDLNLSPLDYSPYRLPGKASSSAIVSLRSTEWIARASGPVWQLPGGPITVSASANIRDEYQAGYVTENAFSVPSAFTYSPPAFRDSSSAYVETRVPIFAESRPGLLRSLEFQGSARADRYRMRARTTTAAINIPGESGPFPDVALFDRKLSSNSETLGLKYAPLSDLALRTSWGTGFLPPNLGQLTSGALVNTAGVNVMDPKRGNILAPTGPIQSIGGGGPTIRPELSESVSAGLIFTPRFLPGFRLSVDLTQITKRDEIAPLSIQQIFDLEDRIPGRIERAPLTPEDQALGYTGGRVTLLRSGVVNVAGTKIEAYDMQADYERKVVGLGRFRVYAIATCQTHLASQALIGAPFIEATGFAGKTRWRANGGVDWERGRWSASWNMQYYGAHRFVIAGSSAQTFADFALNNGRDTIPVQIFHDVSMGYAVNARAEGWARHLRNTRISVGVKNVLNTSPEIMATTSDSGGYSPMGDPRLARYNISVRKAF